MDSTRQGLEIAIAMLRAHTETVKDKAAKERGRLKQAKEAFEERQRKTAARAAEFERRKNNPLSVEERRKVMNLLKRYNNQKN